MFGQGVKIQALGGALGVLGCGFNNLGSGRGVRAFRAQDRPPMV